MSIFNIFSFFNRKEDLVLPKAYYPKDKRALKLSYPMDDRETWFRDTYAIWASDNFIDFHCIAGVYYDKKCAKVMQDVLSSDWGINNKADCFSMVEALKNKGNAPSKEQLSWNLCRATQILAMGYVSRFFNRDTLNAESAKVGRIMQDEFNSWEDLLTNYINGFANWATKVYDEDAEEAISARCDAYTNIINHQDPPYMIDWNIKL